MDLSLFPLRCSLVVSLGFELPLGHTGKYYRSKYGFLWYALPPCFLVSPRSLRTGKQLYDKGTNWKRQTNN